MTKSLPDRRPAGSSLLSRFLTAVAGALLVLTALPSVQAADNNLQISGTLVTEPCTLDVNNNTLEVDFGTVIKKSLYKDVRTAGVPLIITLTDCDTSLGKEVNLTLTGAESKTLPGEFSTQGAGSRGIAIGIEKPDGTPLPVNKASANFGLQAGTTRITLQAYVSAEPDAVSGQSLVAGEFAATAIINADYP